MSFGRYLLGAGELLVMVSAVGYGAARLRARLLAGWTGAPARLAEVVLAASALLLSLELVGLAQIFDPVPIVAVPVLAGLLMARLGDPIGRADGMPTPAQMGGVATGVALALMLLVAVHWATIAEHAYYVGLWGGDDNWYHLPYPARFAQDGSITALHYASPSYLSWFHPVNSELFHAAGMGLFGRDILSPWLNLVWMAVGLLAAWCIGRPFGVAPLTAAAAALAFDLPVFAETQAGAAMSDLFGVTFLLAAAALPLNAISRERDPTRARPAQPGALVIAGLAGGLALGAKLSFAGPVIALIVTVIALAPRGLRRRTALLTALPALATGSFWYLRNFYYVLNPFPYVSKLGPIELPGPDQGLNGGSPYSVAHYLTDGKVWSDFFLPGLRDQVGPVWFLLVGLAVAGIALAVLRNRRNPAVIALAAAAAVALVFYVLTPEAAEGPEGIPKSFTAGLRVLEPALVLGLVLAALATAGLRLQVRWAALVSLAALTLVGTQRSATFWDSGGQLAGAVLIGSALILLPVSVAAAARNPSGRLAGGVAVLVAVGLALGLGWPRTQRYLDHRYRVDDAPPLYDMFSLVPVYSWATGIHDSRIGTSGVLQYGLYGDDLSNHVQFLGRVGSDHSFREITDCRTWRRSVDAGNYDYVVAMPRFGGKRTPEIRWTRTSATRTVLRSGPIVVFRVLGPLDPAGCAKLPA